MYTGDVSGPEHSPWTFSTRTKLGEREREREIEMRELDIYTMKSFKISECNSKF